MDARALSVGEADSESFRERAASPTRKEKAAALAVAAPLCRGVFRRRRQTRQLLAYDVHGAVPFRIKAERDKWISRKLESAQSDFRIDTFAQGKDLKASAEHFRMQ